MSGTSTVWRGSADRSRLGCGGEWWGGVRDVAHVPAPVEAVLHPASRVVVHRQAYLGWEARRACRRHGAARVAHAQDGGRVRVAPG